MKRIIFGACVAAAVLLVPALAMAQHPVHADSPKATLTLEQPLKIGNTVVPIGEYKFQCRHIGDTDMLFVTNAESGKEVARVPCRRQELQSKTKESQFTVSSASGTRTLVSLKIKGETVEHVIVTD
jgi:hypothetical protein